MKNILVYASDVLVFLFEIAAMIFLGRFAYRIPHKPVLKWTAAILAVLLFAIIWAFFFNPKARYTLPPVWYFLLRLLILLFPGVLALRENRTALFAYSVLLLGVALVQFFFGRGEWDF